MAALRLDTERRVSASHLVSTRYIRKPASHSQPSGLQPISPLQCFVSHNASGLQVSCGASLALRGVVADGNRGIGLSAAGAGTLLDASDVQVRASHLHGVEVSGKARGLLR